MSIAALCCTVAHLAARYIAPPEKLDPVFTFIARSALRFYRRFISRHTGRCCLFTPSCSDRALIMLDEYGWKASATSISQQLERCGGNYSLCVSCSGETLLITSDGHQFREGDLSTAFVLRQKIPSAQ